MLLAILIGVASLIASIAMAAQSAPPVSDPAHVVLTLENVLLHIIPAISAGAFAWAGAGFKIKNHGERVERLEGQGSWNRRKTEKLETVHLMRHPEDAPLLHVEPIEGKKS